MSRPPVFLRGGGAPKGQRPARKVWNSPRLRLLLPAPLVASLALPGAGAQEEIPARRAEAPAVPLFNWDIISLEQNNPRFNGSVLTGFHSVRSPGVTPYRGWKVGLGMMYTREEQISELTGRSLSDKNQVLANPKLNWGFLPGLEAGAGFAGSYARGKRVSTGPEGELADRSEEELRASSVDLGVKWAFWDDWPLRLGAAFDTRLAVERGQFGMLPANLFNLEVDGDYAFTRRLSAAGNLQFLTSDSSDLRDQVIADLAGVYAFTDRFRGMLFGTIQEDEEARTVLGFVGIAGQYVFEQHSFTVAFDLQLNDARRDVRTEEQLDVEFSYTFTF